jgi:hypothetical protein
VLLALTLFTTAAAMTVEETTPYVDMALMYAQNQIGFPTECLNDLQAAYKIVKEVYVALTTGESSELFSIILKVMPLLTKLKTDCLGQ